MGVLSQLSQLSPLDPKNEWIWQFVAYMLPVWVLGTLTGWLLPRPKAWNSQALLTSISYVGGLKRIALAINGLLIVRECWYRVFEAGTFRQFAKAVWLWLCGKGWTFDFPHARDPSPKTVEGADAAAGDTWYVGRSDLEFYKQTVEGPHTGNDWELLMEKDLPIIKYKCWRRFAANGKTEYKSTTVCPDATAEEFMDMYFDDDDRITWDTMIVEHEILEVGDFNQRQMVVRWLRKFPFSFISNREYTIARRLFKEGDNLYGITKAVDHPLTRRDSNVVKMDVFYSMWRSRTVPCPWGTDKPACETVLLHHELFKIPENLARFAVKHGMWGFVHKMSQCKASFIEQRRTRCPSTIMDPKAYGHAAAASLAANANAATNAGGLSMRRASSLPVCHSAMSLSSLGRSASMQTIHEDGTASPGGGSSVTGSSDSSRRLHTPPKKTKTLKGFAAFAVASSLAVIMHRSNSCTNLGGPQASESESSPNGKASKAVRNRYRHNRYRYSDSGNAATPLW